MTDTSLVRRFYESEQLERNKESGKRSQKVTKLLLRLMGKGNRILDVGCGAGYNASLLQKAGNYVVGLEISSSNVQMAREQGVDVLSMIYPCRFLSDILLLTELYSWM